MIKVLLILFPLFVSNAQLDSEVDSYLQKNFSNYVKYEYEIMDMPKSFNEIEVNQNVGFRLAKDIVYVPVTVTNANGNFESHLKVKIKLYRFAFIANDNIERNSDLNLSQFRVEIVDVTELREEPLPVHELQNIRSKMFVSKGSALLGSMVEQKPDIEAGDVVWLNSTLGNVNIKISAIARQEGKVEEIIRVKTEDNKLFRAKVLDNKNVLVLE